MLSVLTPTYKRRALLEEAIYSFLLQAEPSTEMVIINDAPTVWYDYYHPRIKIYNLDERFSSLGKKLEYGFSECRYPYVYRLDDDDLLAPNALRTVMQDIHANPGFDIYRTDKNYFFENNQFVDIGGSLNNGNVYAKPYLERITFPDISYGEDAAITWEQNGSTYLATHAPTMCYRWGMATYHLSHGDYNSKNTELLATADERGDHEVGYIKLTPQFRQDYWAMLPLASHDPTA